MLKDSIELNGRALEMMPYSMIKEIDAIDISSKMIKIANNKIGELNIENIKFSQSTIFDDRFENELAGWSTTFDITIPNDIYLC